MYVPVCISKRGEIFKSMVKLDANNESILVDTCAISHVNMIRLIFNNLTETAIVCCDGNDLLDIIIISNALCLIGYDNTIKHTISNCKTPISERLSIDDTDAVRIAFDYIRTNVVQQNDYFVESVNERMLKIMDAYIHAEFDGEIQKFIEKYTFVIQNVKK